MSFVLVSSGRRQTRCALVTGVQTCALPILFGAALEWTVLKPFRHDELNGMIATIGLAMILQNLALMFFGPDPHSMPSVVQGATRLGKIAIPTSRIYVVGFALVVLCMLYVFLKHSRSEENTSELQSLMRNSYAVSCLK